MNSLSVISTQSAQVARVIAQRVAELLHTQVLVSSEQGIIVASSKPGQTGSQVGSRFHQPNCEFSGDYLRVPLPLDAQIGEVIVGQPIDSEAISPRLAKVLVELVIGQATVLSRSPNQQSLKNQFLDDLLRGQTTDEIAIMRQAKLLELNLTPPRAVILVDASDYIAATRYADGSSHAPSDEAAQRRRAQLIIGSIVSFFHLPDDTICADLGSGEVAVLKASDSKNLGKWAEHESASECSSSSWANLSALKRAGDALLLRLRNDTGAAISIGIGRYHPGLLGLSKSYQDARMALLLGRRFNGQNQVYCLDRLGIAAFACVADEQTKIDLAMHLLSPLDSDTELLTTLERFFSEDCCPSSTARHLSIHRNTLSYRLDKVSSLTGLDPRRFDDAVQIRLALLLRKLQLAR